MSELYLKRLDNFWDEVSSRKGRRFLVRLVSADCGVIHSQVTILLGREGVVEVRLTADSHKKYFTDGVVDSFYEDITRLVRHDFRGASEIRCKATFGKTTVERGWNIIDVIKERGLTCK